MDKLSPEVDSTTDILKRIGQYAAYYVLWLIICAIGFWLIFLLRTNLVEDLLFMYVNPWQLRALDRWFVYAAGAVWIVGIFLIEGYLRAAMRKGRLLVAAGRLLLIQGILIVLSFVVHAI